MPTRVAPAEPLPADTLPTSLGSDVGFLLARASGAAVRALNVALEGTGLRARQFTVLRAVSQEGASQRLIADLLGMDASNVVTLIDDLERMRLVERHPDPRDRRTRVITATAEGRRLLATAEPLADQVNDRITAVLSAQERKTLTALVRRLVETVEP